MEMIATDKLSVIVGLGQTGLSCARYFQKTGKKFAANDSRAEPPGLEEFRRDFADVPLSLGKFDRDLCLAADELIVNPGISLKQAVLLEAAEHGAALRGDIELFARAAKAPIIAITGSNGKSTVTTLVGEMAAAAGLKVAVGGNIGTPALDILDDSVAVYVLELSSFQLERCAQLGAEVAVVLNISEDHLDHHGSLPAYHQAKHRIFQGVKKAVVNVDDRLTQPLVPEAVKILKFGLNAPDLNDFGVLEQNGERFIARGSERLLALSQLKIVGEHNVANVLAALALGQHMAWDMDAMLSAAKAFTGLPHRCEFVAEKQQRRFYNDSKATNVGAALAAIRGLSGTAGGVVAICGGQGKGGSYEELGEALVEHCRAVVLIGETAGEIGESLPDEYHAVHANSMSEAVQSALRLSESGDSVLLAPACASFDMFDNYQHRGEQFAAAVEGLI